MGHHNNLTHKIWIVYTEIREKNLKFFFFDAPFRHYRKFSVKKSTFSGKKSL